MIDQNNPGHWMGIGAVFMLLGVVVGGLAETPGLGWFIVGAGGLIFLVGLVIFAVRAGTTKSDEGNR